jgi:phosphoglycolate phosphatase-like HAD superfamily hydrolase
VRLFLFDIDGTLLTVRGAGRTALGRAMAAVYGTSGAIDQYDFRGRTDPRIILDLMSQAGIPESVIRERLPRCFDVYVEELRGQIGDGSRVQVMPGIADIVRALSSRPDAIVGLLTGNIEPGAHVKLRPTGLLPFFRVGAFGSDNPDRRCLPEVACTRAQQLLGHAFSFDRVTIIGDTPLDVDCARSCGALAVAVATGQHPAQELAGCAPDLLFADFSDVPAALKALTAP